MLHARFLEPRLGREIWRWHTHVGQNRNRESHPPSIFEFTQNSVCDTLPHNRGEIMTAAAKPNGVRARLRSVINIQIDEGTKGRGGVQWRWRRSNHQNMMAPDRERIELGAQT